MFVGGFFVPLKCLFIVLFSSVAVVIQIAEGVLSVTVIRNCRFLKPFEGFGVVLLRSVAEVIQFSDVIPHITLENFKQYGIYLQDTVKKHNGDKLAASSVQNEMRAVKAFYNYAIEQGYIEDCSRKLKLPKAPQREQRILDDDEINALFSIFGDTEIELRNKCFIAYMLDCGLRRGEIPRINIEDVDLKNKTTIIKGKGGKQRTVPMGIMSNKLISDYISQYRQKCSSTSPLFVDSNGCRCSDNLIKQLFKRLKNSSDIKRIHPHLLRHTFATYYIADGGDLETLRIISAMLLQSQ